jgi:hypothetical protein
VLESACLAPPATERQLHSLALSQTPEIRTWLLSLLPEKRMVVGSYIYLDGEKHVRAAVAMDAIVADVCARREGTALAYLASPATVYPIPLAAARDAAARYGRSASFGWVGWKAATSKAEPRRSMIGS